MLIDFRKLLKIFGPKSSKIQNNPSTSTNRLTNLRTLRFLFFKNCWILENFWPRGGGGGARFGKQAPIMSVLLPKAAGHWPGPPRARRHPVIPARHRTAARPTKPRSRRPRSPQPPRTPKINNFNIFSKIQKHMFFRFFQFFGGRPGGVPGGPGRFPGGSRRVSGAKIA